MQKFDDAAKTTGASYWLADGVHPTAAGHELIAREWIKACFTHKDIVTERSMDKSNESK